MNSEGPISPDPGPRHGLRLRFEPIALAAVLASLVAGVVLTVLAVRSPDVAAHRQMASLSVWLIALAAVAGILFGIRSHRREARRVAERTAELQQVSDSLLRANRAKNEFLANVSHELRTPLNAIVGFTELLREGVYGDLSPRQALPVQRIEASANHLRYLVDQILDLARIAAGRLEVHIEAIDLRPFLIDVATEVEPLAQERGLALSLTVGATIPRVHTDPTHLRHIVVNLLGNAVKFTTTGGVTLRTRYVAVAKGERSESSASPDPDLPWVAVQVQDTGIGIAQKDRERIFEEFERAPTDPRAGAVQRGTGLGLAISRRLARLLGGELTLESEVGAGSCFTLWLPLQAASPARTAEPLRPSA